MFPFFTRRFTAMNIASKTEHEAALAEFLQLAQADEHAHHMRLLVLRDAIAQYEHEQGYELPLPRTLAGRLEVEMYRLRMQQKQFASFLGVTETRLSQIMRGRRAPNLEFVKRLHLKLQIPGDELLALVPEPA